MNVTVETNPQSEATFHVTLTWQEIDQAAERVYKRLATKHNVPGFRPGHAPRSLLERMVGRDTLYEEAIETLVDDAVHAAAREHELVLLAHPHIHISQVDYGQDHEMTISAPVLGKGELGDYQDIRVPRVQPVVTDAEVDEVIERARDREAAWVPVDRPAEIGDRVTMDLALTVEDKQISNLKDHDFDLVADRIGIYTGLDQEIVGMHEGDEKAFALTIPADYSNASVAGKTANYQVKLSKVAIKELPALDDDFARKAGNVATVAELRVAVRDQLLKNKETTAQRELRDTVIDELIARLTLAVPPMMVDAEADDMLKELGDMMKTENIALEQYLRLMGSSREAYLESVKPDALRRIRQRRVMERLAEHEGLTVSTAELQAMLDLYARSGGAKIRTRVSQLRPAQRQALEVSLLRDKALEWALEHLVTAAPAEAAAADAAPSQDDAPAQSPVASDEILSATTSPPSTTPPSKE